MEQRVTTYSQYSISSNVNGIKNMEAQTLIGGFHGGSGAHFAGRSFGGYRRYVRRYGFGDYSGDGCYTHSYIHRYYCS
jgi:hypothetical protein